MAEPVIGSVVFESTPRDRGGSTFDRFREATKPGRRFRSPWHQATREELLEKFREILATTPTLDECAAKCADVVEADRTLRCLR
jgi:hypothetical protein